MKLRIAEWLDLSGPRVVYGIEAKPAKRWRPCTKDGKPLAFKTKAKAQAFLSRLSSGDRSE